ncbi:MAG: TonB-dependent receptor [Acidobacteria bacterium]|nr:TonB-dependent receptor [Acidobacteriota bacterium]
MNTLVVTPNIYATLEHTHIFSPKLLSKTSFSFSRTFNDVHDVVREGFTYPHPFCNGCAGFDGTEVPGRISGTGFTSLGGASTTPSIYLLNNFQVKEDFDRTGGRHALKFGAHIQRLQDNTRADFHAGGTVNFASIEDFVQGRVNQVSIVLPGSDSIRGWRQSLFGFYLHDDITVRPGLTLNLGVRYEFITIPYEVNGKIANIRDFTEPRIITVNPDNTDIGKPYFQNPSLRNFAPRVGVAWSPFQSKKTVLRGGFGVFHDQFLPNIYQLTGNRGAPFYSYVDLFARDFTGVGGIDFPSVYFSQRDRLRTGGGRPEFRILQYNPNQPYVMKWSLDLDREIMSQMSVGIGYSGSRGVHLVRSNQATNYTPSEIRADGRRYLLIDQPMRNRNFNRMYRHVTDGNSIYHGLRFTMQKRSSRGLQFQSAYTWSKALDDSSSSHGGGEFAGNDHSGDAYAGGHWRGLSAYHVAHVFYTNFVYDLPGQNLTGAVGKLLGGWNVAGIVRLNSGPQIEIAATRPRNGLNTIQFTGGASIELKPGGDNNPQLDGYRDSPDKVGSYFDTSQFVYPAFCFNTTARPNNCNGPSYVLHGNLGRNSLTAPGALNVDFTLTKETPLPMLREGTNLQFRVEFFNAAGLAAIPMISRNLIHLRKLEAIARSSSAGGGQRSAF